MKKIKLIGMALLASTFGLTSCDVPEWLNWIPGLTPSDGQKDEKDSSDVKGEVVSVKINTSVEKITDETSPFKLGYKIVVNGEASKEVAWSSSDTSKARIAADGTVTPVLGASGSVTFTLTSVQDATKSDSVSIEIVTVPGVSAVAVNAPESVYLHSAEAKVEAVVAVKGSPNKGVIWSSSDPEVAAVDSEGNLTLYNAGTVTITATSKFDSSKSGSANIEVIDAGLHPELLADGYSFSKEFPVAAAEFVGEEVYSFEAPEGFYYKTEHYEGSYSSYDYVKVLVEYSEANLDAILEIDSTDYFYFEGSEADCFISASQNHEIDLYVDYLSEDSSDYAFFLEFYRCEDIWETSEPTTDTAWEEETAEALAASGVDLPFIALGAEYDVYVYSSGMIEISDYCADFHKLDNYDAILEEADYVLDEELGCYVKDIDAYSYAMVAFGFSEYGNSIQVMVGLTELDAFPADEVHAFVSEFSENDVPSFDAEGVKYTYQKDSLEFAEDDERETVIVGLVDADGDSLAAYLVALEEAGFDFLGVYTYANYNGYSLYDFIKGKLLVFVEIEFASHAASQEEVYELYAEMLELRNAEELTPEEELRYEELYNGYMSYYFGGEWTVYDYSTPVGGSLYISSEPHMSEEPGIYLLDEELTLAEGEKFQLNPILYGIDADYEYAFSSADESVATVDENGLIKAVAPGSTEIFVSTTDSLYKDSIIVTVPQTKTFADALAEVNALLAADGDTREVDLPEPEGFQYGSVFANGDGYRILASATESQGAYAERLVEYGFEVGVDDYGYPVAISDDFRIEPWTYGSYFIIDVYPLEKPEAEEFSDSLVFSEMGYENTELVEQVSSEHGVTIAFDKGTNSNAPKYYTSGAAVRIYGGGTFTVVAPEDGSLESIVLSFKQDKDVNTVSCDVGTFDAETKTWTAPEGGAESVTFTVGGTSGHIKLASMEINGVALPGGGGGGEQEEVDAAKIMNDVGVAGWGYVEDGDFKEPDQDGVIESNYTIGWEVESPEDSEACLNGVLNEFIADEDFPDYLTVIQGPTYTANAIEDSIGVSEVYLATADDSYILFMYAYCYEGKVSIVFMAGPYAAFAE